MTATQQLLLGQGTQRMRLNILNGGFNLNWLQLTPASTGLIPNGTYTLLNAANTLAFNGITGSGTVTATNYSGSTYQQWNLQHIGGGQYKITAAANGWSWNLNNGSLGFTSGWGTGGGQCFIVTPISGGFYALLPVSNGEPLETSATNQNAIDQNVYSGSANQLWALASPTAPVFPAGLSATATASNQVSLVWNTVTGAASYNVKRSPTSGGPYTTIAIGVTATNYTDTVPVGMRYYYVVSAVAGGSESPKSLEATSLLYPWLTQDIGAVGLAGSASYSNGVFTVTGAGADIWGAADAFRFVYVPVTGNCTITARVVSVQNTDPWSKAGIMIRSNLDANAVNAYIAVTPGNGVTWQTRTSTGGSTVNSATAGLTAPYWVKLVRSGSTFTGYRSPDGVNWTQQGTATTITMASTAYAGLALTSHNSSSLCTATIDNVTAPGWTISAPPPSPTNLTAVVANGSVVLNWTTVSGATSYNLKRAVTYGGPYNLLGNLTATNFTDTALANGVNYYYVVSALDQAGESTNSAQAIVPVQIFTPFGLSATPLSATQIQIVWNTFTNATSYNFKRSPVSGGPYTTIATGVATTNYIDTAPAGMRYYYVVSAITGGLETPNSSEATVNLPYPWMTQDIGAVGVTGNAAYSNGVFTATGGGADIQGTGDSFRFVYLTVTGDSPSSPASPPCRM